MIPARRRVVAITKVASRARIKQVLPTVYSDDKSRLAMIKRFAALVDAAAVKRAFVDSMTCGKKPDPDAPMRPGRMRRNGGSAEAGTCAKGEPKSGAEISNVVTIDLSCQGARRGEAACEGALAGGSEETALAHRCEEEGDADTSSSTLEAWSKVPADKETKSGNSIAGSAAAAVPGRSLAAEATVEPESGRFGNAGQDEICIHIHSDSDDAQPSDARGIPERSTGTARLQGFPGDAGARARKRSSRSLGRRGGEVSRVARAAPGNKAACSAADEAREGGKQQKLSQPTLISFFAKR